MKDDEFARHVLDLMQVVGPVTGKRMFGGHGLFLEGLMIALVSRNVLYLKADTLLAAEFAEQGLAPFTYQRQGKALALSYFEAPEAVFEDQDSMRDWGNKAYGAALRAARGKSGNKTRRKNA